MSRKGQVVPLSTGFWGPRDLVHFWPNAPDARQLPGLQRRHRPPFDKVTSSAFVRLILHLDRLF
jgi:hypothetical protein